MPTQRRRVISRQSVHRVSLLSLCEKKMMMHFFFRLEKCVTLFLSRDIIIMKVVATMVATPTQTKPLPAKGRRRRRRSSRKQQRLDDRRRGGSFVSRRRRTTPTRILFRMAAQHPLKGDDDDDGALDTKNDALLLDRMKIAVQSATARPTQKHVVDALKDLASQEFGLANVKFTEVMQKIDELYDHNPQCGYSSGGGTEGGLKRREAGRERRVEQSLLFRENARVYGRDDAASVLRTLSERVGNPRRDVAFEYPEFYEERVGRRLNRRRNVTAKSENRRGENRSNLIRTDDERYQRCRQMYLFCHDTHALRVYFPLLSYLFERLHLCSRTLFFFFFFSFSRRRRKDAPSFIPSSTPLLCLSVVVFLGLNSPILSTYSIYAIFAASPTRVLVCITRVYPPSLSLYRSANGPNNLMMLSSVLRIAFALRLAANVPSFPSEIILSATLRSSFAFGTVVSIRS